MNPGIASASFATVLLALNVATHAQCVPDGAVPSAAPVSWQGELGWPYVDRVTPTCDPGSADDQLIVYTVPCDGNYTFDLDATTFEPVLEVFDGDPCLGASSLGCVASICSTQASVGPVPLLAGATVWILVDSVYDECCRPYSAYELSVSSSGCADCRINTPTAPGSLEGVVAVDFDALDAQGDPLEITLEFSIDGGQTFLPMTAAPGSPLANPALGETPGTGKTFLWDSEVDLVCSARGFAYVPDGNCWTGSYAYCLTGIVSVIDTSTNQAVDHIVCGWESDGVAAAPSGRRVYITNGGSDDVSVIDTSTNAVVATVPLAGHPLGVAVTPDGRSAYVGHSPSSVSVIDTATDVVTATLAVGAGPGGICVSPDSSEVYVACRTADQLCVLDVSTGLVSATVAVGTWPLGVAVSPDGSRVYVVNSGSNDVSVVDTATDLVVATIPVGDVPSGVAVSPDGASVYVTNSASPTMGVSVIDAATSTVVATVPADYARGISVSPDGASVYAAGRRSAPWVSDGVVNVIDTVTRSVVTQVVTGNDNTFALGNPLISTPNRPPVLIRITRDDGISAPVRCSEGPFDFNNCRPSCTITTPPAGARISGDVTVSFDGDQGIDLPVTSSFEFSTDAGSTWNPATPAPSSPTSNPDPMRPTPFTGRTFVWDTQADAVGLVTPQAVEFRITGDDTYRTSACAVSLVVGDCLTCGDCDLDGVYPGILDSLVAAQIATGFLAPSTPQAICCDVDGASGVDVIDSLLIAQGAAALPFAPMCP